MTNSELTDPEGRVRHFLRYYEEKVDRLEGYEIHAQDASLKKSVLVSILDALSRVVSNDSSGNRDRFTSLISNFCDWPDSTRVSGTHLNHLLRRLRSPDYNKARQIAEKIAQQHTGGSILGIDNDPELSEVRKAWPVNTNQRLIGNISLESITHAHLFYSNRNSLIHDHREPGAGFDMISSRDSPYYIGLVANGETTRELLYPETFHFKLVRSAIANIQHYLVDQKIDPFDCFKFGSSYIEELNP